ncbi:excinuclease ABC subunit C [Chitinophagaceae bacterium IBVUCB1]|nr:excinuclease ABC subunit C [Chitinophagaceae bacterium IBVUCB1]
MQRGGVVYIMCSPNRTTLYIGVTSNLCERVYEHRNKYYLNSFTAKYNCVMLVYYAPYERIEEAIIAEKKLKDRSRRYKEKLIDSINPAWKDLWEDLS